MGKPIFFLRGLGFVNKGSFMMLEAVIEQIRYRYPKANLAVRPSSLSPYIQRARKGLYQYPVLRFLGIDWTFILNLFSKKFLLYFGVLLDRDIDFIIDSSGFSLGDQWGQKRLKYLVKSTSKWTRKGKKVILLPQSFGPFSSNLSKRYIRKIVKNVDLVFPRDKKSMFYLLDSGCDSTKISLYPDFTNLLVVEETQVKTNRFLIIPNEKIIGTNSQYSMDDYLTFLDNVVKNVIELNYIPEFLIHEGTGDALIADEYNKKFRRSIPIIIIDSIWEIKKYIKESHAVVSSRYHGLVSALSQCIPSIATSWSHKYIELLKDYDHQKYLLDIYASEDDIRSLIKNLLDEESMVDMKIKLKIKGDYLKKMSEEMWGKVFSIIK